jgi:hypothetical protein
MKTRLHETRTSSLGAARPLPPRADIGPGGQSVGQAAQFCLDRPSSLRRPDASPAAVLRVLVVKAQAQQVA